MKGRPVPVVIVSILFILVGCAGFVYHVNEIFELQNRYETIWILFLRLLAIVIGVLLLYRNNLARWLAIAWLAYHVVIGAYNSTSQMVTHIVFLIIVSVLLFLPTSSLYFRAKPNKRESSI